MSQKILPSISFLEPIVAAFVLVASGLACGSDDLRGIAQDPPVENGPEQPADAQPGVEVTPLSYDFGVVMVSEVRANAFGVRNSGVVAFTVTAALENQTRAFSIEMPVQTQLQPGEVLVFVVKFTPDAETTYNDRVVLTFDVALDAVGIPIQGAGKTCIDNDGDGYGVGCDLGDDCNDNNPAAQVAGICGCGVADTDTDSDGTPDCRDGCLYDPAKLTPGSCGCGVPEGGCNLGCIPDGGIDDVLTVTNCCSGVAVGGSTYCVTQSDYGTSWASCGHLCGSGSMGAPTSCMPSGGITAYNLASACCGGAVVANSTYCVTPGDNGTTWATCMQLCR